MSKKPVVLMVLDGYGLSDHKEGNAIAMAKSDDEVLVRVESGGGVVHGYGLGASQLQRLRDKGLSDCICGKCSKEEK
jgi:serine protease SohB